MTRAVGPDDTHDAADAFEAVGFPGEEYYLGDVTHANSAYGALVLDENGAIVQSNDRHAVRG